MDGSGLVKSSTACGISWHNTLTDNARAAVCVLGSIQSSLLSLSDQLACRSTIGFNRSNTQLTRAFSALSLYTLQCPFHQIHSTVARCRVIVAASIAEAQSKMPRITVDTPRLNYHASCSRELCDYALFCNRR